MLKISDTVYEIIKEDEIAQESLRQGILNLSAYAKKILPEVERRTVKPVKRGSVVVALSRLSNSVSGIPKLKPEVRIQNISLKSPLCETTFEKTQENIESAARLKSDKLVDHSFFTITQGVGEITMIYPEDEKENVLKYFKAKPKGQYDNLAAVTVNFNEEEYIEVPNMIFALVSALAVKRINLIEVVSTFTEISFVVRIPEMKKTVDALS